MGKSRAVSLNRRSSSSKGCPIELEALLDSGVRLGQSAKKRPCNSAEKPNMLRVSENSSGVLDVSLSSLIMTVEAATKVFITWCSSAGTTRCRRGGSSEVNQCKLTKLICRIES